MQVYFSSLLLNMAYMYSYFLGSLGFHISHLKEKVQIQMSSSCCIGSNLSIALLNLSR